ncbi:hypothetical protein EJ110_NYTH32750 [Nymphaea thermarum]|nr:hypothetical protein EJ110_NYTH32750 [Nymphaea thermarum]
MSRIDRCFISKDWVDDPELIPHLEVLPRSISDHNPILLHLSKRRYSTWGRTPFRHFQYWQDMAGYRDLILSAWAMDTRGCPMIKLIHKLEAARDKLKVWCKSGVNDLPNKIMGLKNSIKRLQTQSEDDIIFFIQGRLKNFRNLKACIDDFSSCSGMLMNNVKSSVLPFNLDSHVLTQWKGGAHLEKIRNWLRSGVPWSVGVSHDDRWVEISVASWFKDGRKWVAGLIRDASGGLHFGLACWFENNTGWRETEVLMECLHHLTNIDDNLGRIYVSANDGEWKRHLLNCIECCTDPFYNFLMINNYIHRGFLLPTFVFPAFVSSTCFFRSPEMIDFSRSFPSSAAAAGGGDSSWSSSSWQTA